MQPPASFEVFPPGDGLIVFRIVSSDEADPNEFLSDEQDGRVQTLLRSNSMALYRGFSVRASLAQAQKLARVLDRRYVAEIELDWRDGDSIARTFRTTGHHTIWAHPDLIAGRVRAIHPVSF